MGRSRKKSTEEKSGLTGFTGLNEKELRKIIIVLAVSSVFIILAIVAIVSGTVRKFLQPEPQLAVEYNQEAEAAQTAESGDAGGEAASGAGEKEELAELVIEPDNKEYIYDFGDSILSQDTVPEITQLMEQYFMSISDCDMPTFLHLFTSRDTSQEELYRQEFELQKQYIEGYQNISCYTVPGLNENEMAVYVYYEIRYSGVETAAPSMVRFYAVKCEDGQYRIYDETLSEELTAFLEQLALDEDVRLLCSQVDQKMEEAMASDVDLKERVDFMKHGAAYMWEADSPAEEAPVGSEEAEEEQ